MKIAEIVEKIKKLNIIKNPELMAYNISDNMADAYQERKENKEKDPMDHTAEEIYQMIKLHPDIKKELLAKILENDNLPDRIFEKVAAKISKDEEIPDSVIPEAVNRADTSISIESINNILENGEVNERDRIKLIQQVDDIKSKKEGVKSELKRLYKECYIKKDSEVTGRIEEIKSILDGEDIDDEVKGWIQTVIAKKMAENFYSDTKKGTKVFTFTEVMPIENMIEKDLASTVEKEYKEIENEKQPKNGRFDKDRFKEQLYTELGKQIGRKYANTGAFVIPQSDNIKKMNESEKLKFIKTIQTEARKPLTKDEIIDIDEQIRGISNNLQFKENTIINVIKQLPKEGKNEKIDVLIDILKDEKKIETIKQLKESGLLEKIENMPTDKRKETIGIINSAVEKRNKYNVDTRTPKVNSVKFRGKPIREDEGR